MNIHELLSYAESFKRPCFQLRAANSRDEVVGHWGGIRSDIAEDTRFTHILSFDLSLVTKIGLTKNEVESYIKYPRTLAHFNDSDGKHVRSKPVKISVLSELKFQNTVPLVAIETSSLPPLEALLLLVDSRIDAWIDGQDLERWEYMELETETSLEYRAQVDSSSAHRDNTVIAQIGGWHAMWPEDHYYNPSSRLLAWTFRDAPPYYEMFVGGGAQARTVSLPTPVRRFP